MNQASNINFPKVYHELLDKSEALEFKMPSDVYVGALLKTLIASKPHGNFLELGTGLGLTLSWMIDGMDDESHLITIDNNPDLIVIANDYFGNDERITIVCEDGSTWLKNYDGDRFDLIFADTWSGKYTEVDEALKFLKKGGFYVIDDMLPQKNWPEGHAQKAKNLIDYLEGHKNLILTKMDWSTGIIIATKIK